MDRLVWDSLKRMIDPEAADTFQRQVDRARKEQARQYYWRPGSQEPRASGWVELCRF
jgi:hypothetical protein